MAEGECFYVMPFIEGVPPDRYADEQELGLRDRLVLLRDICRAVDFAHQHGVLHRDLKPSNILVDEQGQPHVLDFGLAKILSDQNGRMESTMTLESGQILGTPAYMSPEQAAGRTGDIDIRSDVYALGVILYRTLTGCMPYPTQGSLTQTLRHIEETEPLKPNRVNPGFDSEVEAIILKSLAKEKVHRYPSAGALADDIDCFLAGEPIAARRDNTLYLIRKLVRRYRRSVAMILASLVLAAIPTGVWYVRHQSQLQEAYKRYQEALIYFEMPCQPLHDKGIELLDEAIELAPDFSMAYFVRGLQKLAYTHDLPVDSKEHWEILEEVLLDFETADRLAGDQGMPHALVQAADVLRGRAEKTTDPDRKKQYLQRACDYLDRVDRVAPDDVSTRAAWVKLQCVRGDPPLDWLLNLNTLLQDSIGQHLFDAWELTRCAMALEKDPDKDYASAEQLLLRAVELGPEVIDVHRALFQLYWDQGDYEKAGRAMEEVVRLDPSTYWYWKHLGICYRQQNRITKASEAFLEAYNLYTDREKESPSSPDANELLWLGVQFLNLGDADDITRGERLLRQAIELDPASAVAMKSLNRLWRFYQKSKDHENARDIALEWTLQHPSATAWRCLGNTHYVMGNYQEGEDAYMKAITLDPESFETHSGLFWSRISTGHHLDAIRDFRPFVEAHPRIEGWHFLAMAYEGIGDEKMNEQCLTAALRFDENDPTLHTALAKCLQRQGRVDEAKQHEQRTQELQSRGD